MAGSEAKLEVMKERREVNITSESLQQKFLKNLRGQWKKANRSKNK
jgi:hypothetical protein